MCCKCQTVKDLVKKDVKHHSNFYVGSMIDWSHSGHTGFREMYDENEFLFLKMWPLENLK